MDPRLLWWITAPVDQIAGDRLDVPDKRGTLILQDYGADVLLVAHTDAVSAAETAKLCVRGSRVAHPALDDRLGCYAIEQLHRRGVQADLLYTDCEETGRTTGADYWPADLNRYRFILSLDRKGVDCVLYQYEDDRKWLRYCDRHIGPVTYGSFSCISSMEHFGVCGVNVGIGYYEHNTARCWADTRLTAVQIDRAETFIRYARRRKWEFDPIPRVSRITHDSWSLDEHTVDAYDAMFDRSLSTAGDDALMRGVNDRFDEQAELERLRWNDDYDGDYAGIDDETGRVRLNWSDRIVDRAVKRIGGGRK
jgi:hypothetical protein